MDDSIPSQYRQATYEKENGCVWLSACLLIHYVDDKLATAMIDHYAQDQESFEWLDVFHRKKRSGKHNSNLCDQLRNLKNNQYDLLKIKLCNSNESNNLTDIILKERSEGLFVAVLMDDNGNMSHAVGIDVSKQVIYDCMEEKILELNNDNLCTCCGGNATFHHIAIAGELKRKMQKVQKKRKR